MAFSEGDVSLALGLLSPIDLLDIGERGTDGDHLVVSSLLIHSPGPATTVKEVLIENLPSAAGGKFNVKTLHGRFVS